MPDAFTEFTGSLDPALVVVTTELDGERAGCLVGFHAQSSIDPARYCVWLSKANHTYRIAQRSTHLAVHLVADADADLAKWFGTRSGDEVDKFAGLSCRAGEGDVPLLDRCPHRLVLRRVTLLDEGGDHVCVSGVVIAAQGQGGITPLRLSGASGWEAGHTSAERPEPPTERAATSPQRVRQTGR
jgi:flavin reductase (DIM6/NTAB) family NADH-FMN oxidoreductase RutF